MWPSLRTLSRPVPLMRVEQDERMKIPRVKKWKVDQVAVVVRLTHAGHGQNCKRRLHQT